MKINAIYHKINEEDFDSFMSKLVEALKDNPSIIIGPDASLNSGKLSNRKYKEEVYEELRLLSSKSKSLIAPGSITYPINDFEIVCESPLFYRGELFGVFHKEKDNGEESLAKENCLIYRRGDNSKNKFNFKGKDIALEICGDHGSQNVTGCDLELILAYDSRAGFWLNSSNDGFARKVVLCDGYSPKIGAFDYDPSKSPRLKLIPGKNKKIFMSFEI